MLEILAADDMRDAFQRGAGISNRTSSTESSIAQNPKKKTRLVEVMMGEAVAVSQRTPRTPNVRASQAGPALSVTDQ